MVGHAIYQALQKGVFVVIAAGNGKADANGMEIGKLLRQASDDGPADFNETASPDCWGKYFKGALAVGALQTGSSQ